MGSGTRTTSTEFSIPFALSCKQQSFRLFELPEELVDLVTTTPAPRLQLKSASDSSTYNGTQLVPSIKASEYVHLCSEELDKSWSVRQVSTSNEVYVVHAMRRGQEVSEVEDTDMADSREHTVVLTAIAKTDSILELLPATFDIEAHLRKLLPVYDQDQLVELFRMSRDDYRLDHEEEEEYKRLLCQIPATGTSIGRIWRHLCISQCPGPSVGSQKEYFIPTAQLLETAWNSALTAYNIRSSGKETMECVDFVDIGDGADELRPVKVAIWRRLQSVDSSSLDRAQTVTWVTRTLWQSMRELSAAEDRPIQKSAELEKLWRDKLPCDFEGDASVDKLEGGTYERWVEGGEELIRWTGQNEEVTPAHLAAPNAGKRKWHEKFRDMKNMKR